MEVAPAKVEHRRFQYRPGTLLRFAADEVEHKIDIARHVFEFCFV